MFHYILDNFHIFFYSSVTQRKIFFFRSLIENYCRQLFNIATLLCVKKKTQKIKIKIQGKKSTKH